MLEMKYIYNDRARVETNLDLMKDEMVYLDGVYISGPYNLSYIITEHIDDGIRATLSNHGWLKAIYDMKFEFGGLVVERKYGLYTYLTFLYLLIVGAIDLIVLFTIVFNPISDLNKTDYIYTGILLLMFGVVYYFFHKWIKNPNTEMNYIIRQKVLYDDEIRDDKIHPMKSLFVKDRRKAPSKVGIRAWISFMFVAIATLIGVTTHVDQSVKPLLYLSAYMGSSLLYLSGCLKMKTKRAKRAHEDDDCESEEVKSLERRSKTTFAISLVMLLIFVNIAFNFASPYSSDYDRLKWKPRNNDSRLSQEERFSDDYLFAAYATSYYYPKNEYVDGADVRIIAGIDVNTKDKDEKKAAKDFLKNAWGVTDHDSCFKTVNEVLHYGHRSAYRTFLEQHPEVKDMAKHIKKIYPDFNLGECACIEYDDLKKYGATKKDWGKYKGAAIAYTIKGEEGMDAYDYQRLIRVAKISYDLKYISGDELSELYHKLNREIQKKYDSFEQVHRSYYAGEYFRRNFDSRTAKSDDIDYDGDLVYYTYHYRKNNESYKTMDRLFEVKLK